MRTILRNVRKRSETSNETKRIKVALEFRSLLFKVSHVHCIYHIPSKK